MVFEQRQRVQHVPKHRIVRDYLERQVSSGDFPPGSQIPGDERLMELLGVSRGPVRQAITGLVHEGRLRRVQGKGTFVCAPEAPREDGRARSNAICLLMPFFEKFGHVYLEELLRGVETASLELGLRVNVLFMPSTERVAISADRLKMIVEQIKDSRGVVSVAALSLAEIQAVLATGAPFVSVHTNYDHFGLSVKSIKRPYEKYCALAAQYLLDRGHRNILYLDYPRPAYPGQSAFINCAEQRGAAVKTLIQDNPFRVLEALRRILVGGPRWTALFASRWELTKTISDIVTAGELRVPEDIGCLGYAEVDTGGPITLLAPRLFDTGRAAVQLICGLIPQVPEFDPVLVERGSCPRLPPSRP